jgi:hypothetical protein
MDDSYVYLILELANRGSLHTALSQSKLKRFDDRESATVSSTLSSL